MILKRYNFVAVNNSSSCDVNFGDVNFIILSSVPVLRYKIIQKF